LSAKIAIFLTILMFHIIVNAAEPNLGDARLFFSSEQRASMLSSKVKDSASTSIPTKSSTPIKTRPIVKLPDFVISGTLVVCLVSSCYLMMISPKLLIANIWLN